MAVSFGWRVRATVTAPGKLTAMMGRLEVRLDWFQCLREERQTSSKRPMVGSRTHCPRPDYSGGACDARAVRPPCGRGHALTR